MAKICYKGEDKKDRSEEPALATQTWQKLLRHVPGILFQYRINLDGKQTFPYVSDGVEDILEVSSCAATSNAASVLRRIHPQDVNMVISSMSDAAESFLPWQLQFRMISRSGKVCWMEVVAAPDSLPDGTILWSGYAREVNERKTLEDALRVAQEDLIRLSEERTQRLQETNDKLTALNLEIKAEIRERIQLEKKLKESYALLSSLAENLVRSEERERRRIAVELHDNVVQNLALLKLRVDVGLNNGRPLIDVFEEISTVLVEAMQQTREICNDLSPPVLYDFGLAKALQSLGNGLAQKSLSTFDVEYDLEDLHLPDYCQAFLYQTARELLVNAIKHAKATKIKVTLKANDSDIRLTVEDNGIGFQAGKKTGFGLSNIQQRTAFHKGALSISTTEMKTVIAVQVPATCVQGEKQTFSAASLPY